MGFSLFCGKNTCFIGAIHYVSRTCILKHKIITIMTELEKMQLLYTYATAGLPKVKNEYTTGVNVDNGREDITDGSTSDHLTTRFTHVQMSV